MILTKKNYCPFFFFLRNVSVHNVFRKKTSVYRIYQILDSWQWLNYWNVPLEYMRLRIWKILCLADTFWFISYLSIEDKLHFSAYYITCIQIHICTCTHICNYTDTINTMHSSCPRRKFCAPVLRNGLL